MSDDKVGYGKPPKANQFKKGQSGNPAGRKKGSKNLATRVREALEDTVTINVNGKRRKVSKLDAAFMQQANRAASGDLKATKLMIDILGAAEQREDAAAGPEAVTPEARRQRSTQILAALRARLEGREEDDGGQD